MPHHPVYPPSRMMLAPVVSPKYLGKSWACTRPNIWRGMFLNMVRPTKKVFLQWQGMVDTGSLHHGIFA